MGIAERLNPPTDFSIVEEYIEDQAPVKIHDAFNRIKAALNTGSGSERTTNSDYAAAIRAIIKLYFGNVPESTIGVITDDINRLNVGRHFA